MSKSNPKIIKIESEYITLGQFLKFADVIDSGAMAKIFILEHDILVNGEDCKMRGKKLREGDVIEIDNSLRFEIGKWLLKN